MSYTSVLDLTTQGQRDTRKEQPAYSPFPAPDPELPEITARDLSENLQAALKAMDWPGLMPVQSTAIPYMLAGQDLIVQSRTGSGKTGAFLLPLLDSLDANEKTTQALVLCPTRELAKQILGEFDRMNSALPTEARLRTVSVYGGTAYGPQLDAFKAGAQLVVGTPGRILDHLQRGALKLDNLRTLILDEADEMLSMGFYPDMRKLKRYLPSKRTGYMWSATMPYAVQRVGREFLNEPGFLTLSGGTIHVDIMSHRAYLVDPMAKDRTLVKLIEMENPESAIVFTNTKREVEYLATFLSNYGIDAAGISSDLTQKAREKVMGRLRKGELRILVATDVAARGIDVSDLSHVFQYDVPKDREYYIHRAGRTARAGKSGVAISFVTASDRKDLKEIERKYEIDMEWKDVPTDEEASARVGERLINLLEDEYRELSNLDRERIKRFVPIVKLLVEEGEPEILAMLLEEAYEESLHEAPPTPKAKSKKEKKKDKKKDD